MSKITISSRNALEHVHVRQRGSKWSYRFEKAKVDGKRQTVERSGFATREDAQLAGIKAYEDYQHGIRQGNSPDMSFADFLDIWFERTKLDARNNTLELREKNIRLHLKPALGSYRLTSLSPQIIDGFVRQKRQDGYSYETVDRMLSNIKVALDYAIWPMELLKANPAQLIKVPGKNFAELSRRRPRRRIENDELVQLFDHFPFGNTYHMPLALGLYFGTRIGETLGLSWADCDLDARELHIRLQIQRLSMRGHHSLHYLCDLKTESSHRTLAFDSEIVLPLLRRWRQQQRANELAYGEDYFYNYILPAKDYQGRPIQKIVSLEKCYPTPGPRLDLICTQPNGKYIKPCSLSYQCKRIREMGIRDFDFHCLRHTNLTMLGESHASLTEIMTRAGHSDAKSTMTYVDSRLEMQERPVQMITKKLKHIL
ncbi:tyrosine-type recombinase/integrase [Mitsuokella jalaludinii]|uniref:tyrosine-type recombinase/integrase n=1 Tax=Mitsuokella jalaludinii TaxID=187979 RepID=UPI00307E51B5